ncbi:MAG: AraC family transcriptional regulator [Gracilimonas sp.]|nr:AraC family transcriptional regulator [Gracilimonas sp.]
MKKYMGTKVILDAYRQSLIDHQYPHDIQRAINYIHTHCFDERLNINLLKEVCKQAAKVFLPDLNDLLGKYPKGYILHHRIKAGKIVAKRETFEESITLIALELGFRSNSSFCKAFRNEVASSPSEWRRKNKSFNIFQNKFSET